MREYHDDFLAARVEAVLRLRPPNPADFPFKGAPTPYGSRREIVSRQGAPIFYHERFTKADTAFICDLINAHGPQAFELALEGAA